MKPVTVIIRDIVEAILRLSAIGFIDSYTEKLKKRRQEAKQLTKNR